MKQYTGKNIEDLLNSIAENDNCSKDDIFYNVIEEKKGILGIGNSAVIEASSPKDVKEFIFNYLGAYFEELNQGVSIEIIIDRQKDENNSLLYRVILDAENNAIIIGKNGQTLHAISQVLKAATSATFKRRINIVIDVNHYKEDRYKKIKGIAARVAKEVAKTHIDASLDPMPNDERKIIHQHLQGFKNVTTVSEGDGNKRHIIVKYIESDAD